MSNRYRPEFRCTRTKLYNDPNCQGHTNLSAREGHYINANSKEEALATMAKNNPGEHEFTADLFKTFDDEGRVTQHDLN